MIVLNPGAEGLPPGCHRWFGLVVLGRAYVSHTVILVAAGVLCQPQLATIHLSAHWWLGRQSPSAVIAARSGLACIAPHFGFWSAMGHHCWLG